MSGNINVAIGHTAGSGKDTLAALIVQRNKHYRRALADAGKEELGCALLNLDRASGRLSAWQFVESQKHRPEMRLLMQAYMDGKRELVRATYWINQLLGYMEEYRGGEIRAAPLDPAYEVEHAGIVVSDCRYPNEIKEFLARGFLCIDLFRPDAPPLPNGLSAHRSEVGLLSTDFPYLIVNDGTPEEMLALYDDLVAHHLRNPLVPRSHWPLIFARGIDSAKKLPVSEVSEVTIERPPFRLTGGPIL